MNEVLGQTIRQMNSLYCCGILRISAPFCRVGVESFSQTVQRRCCKALETRCAHLSQRLEATLTKCRLCVDCHGPCRLQAAERDLRSEREAAQLEFVHRTGRECTTKS